MSSSASYRDCQATASQATATLGEASEARGPAAGFRIPVDARSHPRTPHPHTARARQAGDADNCTHPTRAPQRTRLTASPRLSSYATASCMCIHPNLPHHKAWGRPIAYSRGSLIIAPLPQRLGGNVHTPPAHHRRASAGTGTSSSARFKMSAGTYTRARAAPFHEVASWISPA
jgi:hypothetical protein